MRFLHCRIFRRRNFTPVFKKFLMTLKNIEASSGDGMKRPMNGHFAGAGNITNICKNILRQGFGRKRRKVPQDGISSLPIRARKMPMTSFGQMNFPVFPLHPFAVIITPICIPLLKLFHRRNPAGKHSSINHPDSLHLHGPK